MKHLSFLGCSNSGGSGNSISPAVIGGIIGGVVVVVAIIIVVGYVVTMATMIGIGKVEGRNEFVFLNRKQFAFSIINFALFFPLVFAFSTYGYFSIPFLHVYYNR